MKTDNLILISLALGNPCRVHFANKQLQEKIGEVTGPDRDAALKNTVAALKAAGITGGKLRIINTKRDDIHLEEKKQESSATLLRPGYIVSLATHVRGGVVYARKDLDERCGREGKDAMGAASTCKLLAGHDGKHDYSEMTAEEITRWETTRTIADKKEHEQATKIRNKIRALITSVCSDSNFGLLCSVANEDELDAAYAEGCVMRDAFNETSQFTRIDFYMLKGLIPETAMSKLSLTSELRGLIDQMIAGIKSGDVAAIRDAANQAKQLEQMLDEEAVAKMMQAVEEARAAAREIVKREKGGEKTEAIGQELAKKSKSLESARKTFDLDEGVLAQIAAQAKKYQGQGA